MKYMTRRIFDYLEPIMPDAKKDWLLDMQAETLHIQNPFKRAWFVLGCLQVALGLILYDRFGVRRVGQTLIGTAILVSSIFGTVFIATSFNSDLAPPVYVLLLIYSFAGVLALTSLYWMKRYLVLAILSLSSVWLFLIFISTVAQKAFLTALTFEAVMIMTAFYVAATFIDWSGGAEHV